MAPPPRPVNINARRPRGTYAKSNLAPSAYCRRASRSRHRRSGARRRLGHLRQGRRATTRSRPAAAPSSPAPTTARRWRWPIPTAASNGAPRASSPARLPTMTRRSRPTRSSRRPTTTAASPMRPATITKRPSPTTTRRSSSSRDYASALNNRGLAYFNKGQHQRAIADYDEAIKLEPDAVRLNNRGNAYASRGQHDRAIQDFDEAVEPRRATTRSRSTTAATPISPRATPTARSQNYDRALTLNPKYQDALVNRGVAHEKKGGYDRAIADYNEALKLDDKDAMALQQPRQRAAQEGQDRRRHRRLRPGAQARRQVCGRLFQPRHRPREQEALRRRDRRLPAGDASCSRRTPRPGTPLLGARGHRPPAGRDRRLQRSAEAAARLRQRARQPRLRAAARRPVRRRPLPTTTRRWRSSRTRSRRSTAAAWPSAARATSRSGNVDIAAARAIRPNVMRRISRLRPDAAVCRCAAARHRPTAGARGRPGQGPAARARRN